jgi:hypothetical protein
MLARRTGSPDTVVTPIKRHLGCMSRYARHTASSMSEPISVSSNIFSFSMIRASGNSFMHITLELLYRISIGSAYTHAFSVQQAFACG